MIRVKKQLLTPQEIKNRLSLSDAQQTIRAKKINEICNILLKKDNRLLVIVGPCSADNEEAFYEYLQHLKVIEQRVSDRLLLIPRLYTAKPRSRGDSYKGILFCSNPRGGHVDIGNGLIASRRMFINALSNFGFVCADELLHTETYEYFDDLAAYVVIGARNAESQQHRFLASGLDIPVAFKNPMSGNLGSLCNAIYTAQRGNEFIYDKKQVFTDGNLFSHAILRGGVDRDGQHFANYGAKDLLLLLKEFNAANIANPSVIIDVNHSNSVKNYLNQGKILFESFKELSSNNKTKDLLAGYMIESYLKDGACSEGNLEFGKSVTDGCLGIEKTEELIEGLYELMLP